MKITSKLKRNKLEVQNEFDDITRDELKICGNLNLDLNDLRLFLDVILWNVLK